MNGGTQRVARPPQWIACRRKARSVMDGEVFCPRGALVAWQLCLECHLLEAVDDEREFGCGDFEQPGPATLGCRMIGAIQT